MRKILLLSVALMCCALVLIGCGDKKIPTPVETSAPTQIPELVDGKLNLDRYRSYTYISTVSECEVNRFFTSYTELEAFVNESGLVKNISVLNADSLIGLLSFCPEEVFNDYNVALFIPEIGDLKYDGYVESVTVEDGKSTISFAYWTSIQNKLLEEYSIGIALKLPKIYCDENTEIAFSFGERVVLPADAPYIEEETEAPSTTVIGSATDTPDEPKLPLGQKVTSLDNLDMLDAPSDKIEVVKAFLSNDIRKLEQLCYYDEGVYGPLMGVEISSFEVWAEESPYSIENDIFMNITISKVENEYGTTLTVGDHTLQFGMNYDLEEVDRRAGNNCTPVTETEKFISAWFSSHGHLFNREYNVGYTENYVWFIHLYYTKLYGEGGTRAEYEKYYKTLYGVDVTYELDSYLTFENGGKAEIKNPHGGFGLWFDFVESGDDYVIVQFYADHGYLIYAPRIKYTFTRSDGILVPLCYEYLYNNNLKPASFSA